MKKLLIPLLALITLNVSAQKLHYAFTLLAGPSLDWYKPAKTAVLNGAPSNRNINGSGYSFTLRYDYLKGTYVGFGTEIVFDHTRAGIFRNYDITGLSQPFPDSAFIHYFSMNTLDVPLFLKIRLFNGRYNTSYTFFHFGPGVQILLGAKRKVMVNNIGYQEEYPDKTDHPNFTNAVSPFLMLGMGRIIMTRKYVFTLELDYNAGLSNWKYVQYTYEPGGTPVTDAFRRSSLLLNLGIRLQNYRQPGCHEF